MVRALLVLTGAGRPRFLGGGWVVCLCISYPSLFVDVPLEPSGVSMKCHGRQPCL